MKLSGLYAVSFLERWKPIIHGVPKSITSNSMPFPGATVMAVLNTAVPAVELSCESEPVASLQCKLSAAGGANPALDLPLDAGGGIVCEVSTLICWVVVLMHCKAEVVRW